MGLLSSKVKSIDVSKQQQETGRQRGITDQRAYEDLELADLFDTELYDTNRRTAEDQYARYGRQIGDQYSARVGRIADQTGRMNALIDSEAGATRRYNRRTLNNARRVADAASRNESDDNASDDYFDTQDQNLADRRAVGAREGADRRGGRLSDMLAGIDEQFGGFDDGYYDGVAQQYVNARKPRVEQNYQDRTRRSTFDLARKGNYESSASARVFSRLAQAKADEEAQLAAEGASRANALRSQIEQQRSRAIDNAYSAIESAPDDILDEGMRGSDIDPRFAMKTQGDIDGGMQDRGVQYPKFGTVAGSGAQGMTLGRPGGGFGAQGGAGRSYSSGMTVTPNARTGGPTPAKRTQAPAFQMMKPPDDEEGAFANMRERASSAPLLRVM